MTSSKIWHPFTPQLGSSLPIKIARGDGIYLIDEFGNRYIDAISSWWVNLHGHCNPYISEKVSKQLFTLEHSIFSGFTHDSALLLADRLLGHLPDNQAKVFFSDDGSTAVEVAVKMTLQYWHNQGQNRTTFIAFDQAYHGDTFGGMSVGARNVFNNAFTSLLFDVVHLPIPTASNIKEVRDLFLSAIESKNIAGFIFEPLVQGAAGMRMYESRYLDELMDLVSENKIITIADEVMTGFGRTGRFFASDYLKNAPDIFCLSKGLTGGYLPLGVTTCAGFIHNAFLVEDQKKTFFHGHSYTGNPTACSAALASLDLLEDAQCWAQIKMIEGEHLAFKERISGRDSIKEVRILGTILAIELNSEEGSHYLNSMAQGIAEFFLQEGIIIRPLGNVFYLIPPYVINKSQLGFIYSAIVKFLMGGSDY